MVWTVVVAVACYPIYTPQDRDTVLSTVRNVGDQGLTAESLTRDCPWEKDSSPKVTPESWGQHISQWI